MTYYVLMIHGVIDHRREYSKSELHIIKAELKELRAIHGNENVHIVKKRHKL